MKCRKCKNDIDSDSVFCEFCGEKIKNKEKSYKHLVEEILNKKKSETKKEKLQIFLKKNVDAMLIVIGSGIVVSWIDYDYNPGIPIGVMMVTAGIMVFVKRRKNNE